MTLLGNYAKYAASREFKLSLSKTISEAANVTIIRVNGMRVNDFNFYLKVYMADKSIDDIKCLFTEVEVNSGGYLLSHKATRYKYPALSVQFNSSTLR